MSLRLLGRLRPPQQQPILPQCHTPKDIRRSSVHHGRSLSRIVAAKEIFGIRCWAADLTL
jgi:hypothetical protein